MPISIYREWLATPEFHDLPDERRSRILSNYFDENLANDEFAKLEPDRQKRIKSNFLKEHEDFFKDINYKAASIYDRVAKTVDDGDKEVPASPGGVMLMPDGQRLKWTGEDFESDTGKRVSIYEAALDSYDQQEKQRAARPESEKHGALETLGRGLVRGTYQAGAATADWGGIIADRAKRDWVNLSEYGKAQKQASRAMDVGLDEIAGKTREIPEVDFKQVGPTALAEKLHGKSQEWRDIARYGLAKDEDIQGAILDNPALLADLRWWADGLGEMAPSLAATIIPGAGAGKAIQVLGKGAKLTPAVVSRLVRFGSAISGGAAGGMFEGGSTYNELIEKGATEEQASRAATNMALASSVLNALSVDKLLGKSRPGLRNKLAKFMRDGTWESSTEIAEEPVEAVIKWSEGYANKDEILEQLWNAPNIAPIAFVMGAGGSIVAGETTNSNQTQTPPGAPTAPASPAPGMEKATDADLQQSFGRAREALGQDQDNPEKRKAFIDIKREVERRQQAPAQPDALRNQANDLRLQLVKEPDEQKRAGILDQLTRVEQQLQESGVQRTDIGTPLQTSETVKPDTRPSATSELDALRQESERLNTELEDSHKRTRGLQEKISGTANDHTKRMILIEQLAAEVQEYKSKLDRQSGIERRAGELRAAAARQLLPAPPESALQSAVDPNLITPTRGSMAESQVEAGMVENPLERGGVEASTARARQQRTVSQPSAVAPEAVDMATDYGVRTESEAKINSMPRKELNALAKSLKMDFKGKIDELRKRLIKRGVDPALLGIDRVAIRQKVESALSQRADSIQRQNPPENPPEPPVPPAPTTPKGPAPTGPAPQGTSPSVPVTTKPEPSTPSQSSEKPPVSSAPETTVEDIADLNVRDEQTGLTRAEAESLYDEEQELARKLPNNVGKARMEGKLSKRQLDIVDRLDEIERLLPNTSKQYREIAKESRAKTTAEYEAKRYAYAEEQRQKLLQKNGLEVGDQVETIVPGMLGAARYRGVVKQRKNGSVYVLSRGEAYDAFRVAWLKVQGEGTVSREAGPKQSEPKQRKPRSTKPEQPAHEIPFVTWAQKTMNRLAGKRNATLQLPSVQDVKGSHEFWTGADVLDERVRNEANYRNMTKGEKYVSKKKMREFTGFTEFNTRYNGDVTIEQ